MKIYSSVTWDMSGDEVVEIASESYEYDGPVAECKGGGDAPDDNTAPYSYTPNSGVPPSFGDEEEQGSSYNPTAAPYDNDGNIIPDGAIGAPPVAAGAGGYDPNMLPDYGDYHTKGKSSGFKGFNQSGYNEAVADWYAKKYNGSGEEPGAYPTRAAFDEKGREDFGRFDEAAYDRDIGLYYDNMYKVDAPVAPPPPEGGITDLLPPAHVDPGYYYGRDRPDGPYSEKGYDVPQNPYPYSGHPSRDPNGPGVYTPPNIDPRFRNRRMF